MIYAQLNLMSYILVLHILHTEEMEGKGLREGPKYTGVKRARIQTPLAIGLQSFKKC